MGVEQAHSTHTRNRRAHHQQERILIPTQELLSPGKVSERFLSVVQLGADTWEEVVRRVFQKRWL